MTQATPSLTAAPGNAPVQAALGDPQTLEKLRIAARLCLSRARPGMLQTLLAQLVDDVVSRTAETALRKQFDPARGASVLTWLNAIVRVVVKKVAFPGPPRATQPVAVDWDMCLRDKTPTPGEQAMTSDERERVRAAMQRLDPRDRRLLEMHYFDDLTAVEIGEQLSALPSTIRVRLHRARKEVEELLAPSRQEGDS